MRRQSAGSGGRRSVPSARLSRNWRVGSALDVGQARLPPRSRIAGLQPVRARSSAARSSTAPTYAAIVVRGADRHAAVDVQAAQVDPRVVEGGAHGVGGGADVGDAELGDSTPPAR